MRKKRGPVFLSMRIESGMGMLLVIDVERGGEQSTGRHDMFRFLIHDDDDHADLESE